MAERNPAEESAEKIVRQLEKFDRQMREEGFSMVSRRRTIAEILGKVLEECVASGLMHIPPDVAGDEPGVEPTEGRT